MIITGELKKWYKSERLNIFWGNIYGDVKSRWPDGRLIHTSTVEKIEEYDDHFIVVTLNSVYKLNKCDKAA